MDGEGATLMELLRTSPKLRHPHTVLEGFERGDEVVHVIVSIRADDWAGRVGDLRDIRRREEVRNRARSIQEPVFQRLNLQEIRLGNHFSYMPAFAASVTRQGLAELLDDPDIESLEPDRILTAHTPQGIPLMDRTPRP